VQGYVYAAKLYAAELASALGLSEQADSLRQQASELQRKFEDAFWCPDLSTYALALDGEKRQCRVRTSNAGHALFAGIASPKHAELTAKVLLSEPMFGGWGVRTVAKGESRYNPMSYHDGSVWPHDNALIAAGLARYGFKGGTLKILDALFEASSFLELHRLPELYCGFDRRPGEGPTPYPVACSPQTWAAAAVFHILGSCLGISISASRRLVSVCEPVLPACIQKLQIRELRVGEATTDLSFERSGGQARVSVTRKSGDLLVREHLNLEPEFDAQPKSF
jgi:glycogen debranching enzyme